MSNSDHFFMHKAIVLAKKGLGKTHPNPCVGAIVVKNKKVLGQGFHLKAGQEHAEIIALKQAGNKARNAELYVTLEPCTHQGKTPPCVDSIINAGISRVIIGAKNLTGKRADQLLGMAHITVNKNSIPNDPESPFVTSGIRLGTPAITTRGFKEKESIQVANLIADVLDQPDDEKNIALVKNKVNELTHQFPVYSE